MMKRILFLLLMFLADSASWAQVQEVWHRPFAEDHKVWLYQHLDFPWKYEWEYYSDGDTIIGGKECYRIFLHQGWRENEDDYVGAIYDDGGKSYIILSDETTPKMLFDFDAVLGDTLNVEESVLIVKHDTIVNSCNRDYRVLFLFNSSNSYDDSQGGNYSAGEWIEGIGSTAPYFVYSVGWSGYDHRALCACFVEGEKVYECPWYVPDPTTIRVPATKKRQAAYSVFDLQGRKVSQSNKVSEYQGNKLPKGIYIQNGRKFVIK